MGYSKRIDTLCTLLKETKVFADVGCDHGYCSEYMLKNGLCKKAILSDISAPSLQKAKELLTPYILEGKATAVLGDGFFGVPKDTDEVLIAGMGGEEIVKILSDKKYGFLPKQFLLQPMLNPDKVRKYLLDNGGYIERDFTFFADGKYYDVIVGRKKKPGDIQEYTNLEIEFGRDNLKERNEDFLSLIKNKLKDFDKYLSATNLQEKSREDLLERKKRYEEIVSGEVK